MSEAGLLIAYQMELELIPERNRYEADMRICVHNISGAPIETLQLALGRVRADLLRISGACSMDGVREQRTALAFRPAIPAGKTAEVALRFTADLPCSEHWGDDFYEFSTESGWYPRPTVEPAQGCAFDVRITVPEGFCVCATGRREGDRWTAARATNFGFAASRAFPALSEEHDGMRFTCLYPLGAEQTARSVIADAKEAVRFYRGLFGFYPTDAFNAIPGCENWGGGCPVATGVYQLHGMRRVNGPFPNDNWIICHELAHQYFGDTVDFTQLSWVWLMLGLSLDHAYCAAKNRSMEPYASFQRRLNEAISLGKAAIPGDAARLRECLSDGSFDYNTNVLHAKAAAMALALQKRVGSEAYFGMLRRYFEVFGCRTVSEETFIRFCECELKTPLRAVFERWLRENAYPE